MRTDEYLDQEIDLVEPFDGPAIQFSHIQPDDTGLRPYQSAIKHEVYNLWDKMNNVMLQID